MHYSDYTRITVKTINNINMLTFINLGNDLVKLLAKLIFELNTRNIVPRLQGQFSKGLNKNNIVINVETIICFL